MIFASRDDDGRFAWEWAVAIVVIVVACCAFSGCASEPERPITTAVQIVERPVPVPVSCIKAADIPPKTPTAMPSPDADIGQKASGASADVRALEAENDQLRAALAACATLGDKQ